MNAHYSMYFITFYFYIISELQFYIIFNILLDNEVMETSKRRSFLPLIFIIKCISKRSLIRILRRENQLHLFRRLEQSSSKQIKCDGAIEFLRLCQNLDLTPTFAKVDQTKSKNWQQSSKAFSTNVITEELRSKMKQNATLKMEMNTIYDEIRQQCSLLQYMLILRVMTDLRKKLYEDVMTSHTSKIARLINKEFDVDEHITNISSYRLSFFEKLVLCRGLKFSIAQPVPARDIKASFEKSLLATRTHITRGQKRISRRDSSLDCPELHRKERPKTTQSTATSHKSAQTKGRHRHYKTRQRIWRSSNGQDRVHPSTK